MKKSFLFFSALVVLIAIAFGAGKSRSIGGMVEKDGPVQGTSPTATALNDPASKPLPPVKVEIVTSQPLSRTALLNGTVVPTRTARLASPGEGPVGVCATSGCMVREGDRVAKGQTLLQISRNKSAQAQMTAAAQALKEQETELQRITQLVQGGAVPGAQLDAARSKYENARAQFIKTEESASDYLISAPWSGVISKVHVAEGDYVAPRAPLITMFDPASLVVQFAVAESQSTEVREGLPVDVQLDAHPGQTFQGTINRVFPELDERTRTRTAEAALTGPVDLIPGMFARIQVTLERFPEALTVPAHSLAVSPGGVRSVFLVRDGKAVQRELTTGLEVDGRVQVLAGLQEGDRVIIAGQEKLKDGTAVKMLEPDGAPSEAKGKGGGQS